MVPAPAHAHRRGNKQRVRAIKCPVCTVALTLDDLRGDVALLRRVKRAEAASQRDVEDELTGVKRRRSQGGRRSGITVASDEDGQIEDDDDDDDDDDDQDDDDDGDGESDSDSDRARVKRQQIDRQIRIKSERSFTQDPMDTDEE